MLEGPSARRKQIAHDEMRRELQRQFPKVDTGVVTDLVTKYFADEVEQAEVSRLLNEEQRKIVGQEFAADSGDTSKVVLYVTNQTNDRHLRYRCNRLRLSFVCLRLDYEEVDIAGNKWLREKLCKVAQTDELPLVFVGMGADVCHRIFFFCTSTCFVGST
ncbi:hypothetical protein DIPPA_28457 [Diplonema papillatum]|nr:hypothetical protein DIPPA_28457 [Diplonema papillatum]